MGVVRVGQSSRQSSGQEVREPLMLRKVKVSMAGT